MNSTTYSISADSRRWWWPSAAAGTVAVAVILAIPAAAGSAVPDRGPAGDTANDGVVHLVIGRAADCPAPPDPRYVGGPWVPAAPTGCASLDRWWTLVEQG